jgi:type IV secretion system protein VirD4
MSGRRDAFRERVIALLLVADVPYAGELATEFVARYWNYARPLGRPVFQANAAQTAELTVLAVGLSLIAVVALAWAPARRIAPPCMLLAVSSWIAGHAPVYMPYDLLRWAFVYRSWAPMNAEVTRGVCVFGGTLIAVIAGTLGVLPSGRPTRKPTGSHGTAHWGNTADLLGESGLILGQDRRGRYLRYAGDGHLLTVAPTRSGKGTGCVIPNLLTYPGGIVVTDPKGENYAVTARARSALGSRVQALDPFGIAGGEARFNPMDLIDATKDSAYDDAWLLADMLVVADRSGRDDAYWDEEARALLAGLILYVVSCEAPAQRSLGRVRGLLTLSTDQFTGLIHTMQASKELGGLIERAANRIAQKEPRERSHVISAAQSHTHFLDSPAIARVISGSTIALGDLAAGALSLYVILPSGHLEAYRRWMRLVIGSALRVTMAARGRSPHRVLFLLDEFANLGPMRPVEHGVALAAGFGVTFWLLVQDLAQLRREYGASAQTFLANADVLQAFGVNDWETAEHLSRLAGESTILVTSDSHSSGVTRGRGGSSQEGEGETVSERGRRLITADEVRRLGADDQLLFPRGKAPLRIARVNYLGDRVLAAIADRNPLHESAALYID